MGVQSHDNVDDTGGGEGGVQNWPKVDGVICARSLIITAALRAAAVKSLPLCIIVNAVTNPTQSHRDIIVLFYS